MNTPTSPTPLPEAITVAYPLVQWLVAQGVGYNTFAHMIKPLFLAAAIEDAQTSASDSALSLRSGLHRKDVRALRQAHQHDVQAIHEATQAMGKPSPASRVLAMWRAQHWPARMPLNGAAPSFQSLVAAVSNDFHHRAILQELQRLGQVQQVDADVELIEQGMRASPQTQESRQLLAGSVADHLQAGVCNLQSQDSAPFLEQSVFADGLSADSIEKLHALARELWRQHVLPSLVNQATELCEQDQHTPDAHRFRCGMFSYSASEPQQKGAA
ncbi:MAG: DUF6502 family protein [Pseudomonadota bacterium]|jgi:hypothetical protein